MLFSVTLFCISAHRLSAPRPFSQVIIRDAAYTLLIADTPTKRRTGLMYRTYLPEQEGMLFVYEAPTFVDMWMKNTPISLDMLWIDANGKIVHIEKNTTPYSEKILSSPEKATFVLEINAGESDKNMFEVGDTIRFQKSRLTSKRTQENVNPNPSSPLLNSI